MAGARLAFGGTNARIDAHFRELHLPSRVAPGETVSGFVFTNLDEGFKYVNVELVGLGNPQVRRFTLLAKRARSQRGLPAVRRAETLRTAPRDLDEPLSAPGWRPCRAASWAATKDAGDPLKVVVVGERSAVFLALARRGWNATQSITVESSLHIAESSVFAAGTATARYRRSTSSAAGRTSPSRRRAQRGRPHPHAPVDGFR